MIDNPEFTNNAQGSNAVTSRTLFDSAFDFAPRESSSTTDFSPIQEARSAYTAAGGRLASDAWAPPVMVADASKRSNLTTTTDATSTTDRPAESVSAPAETKEAQPSRQEVQTDAKAGQPEVKEKPLVDINGKEIDTKTLTPELANEAKLMQTLTGPQREIVGRSFTNVGQKLWAQSEHKDLTGNGAYGCAASESIINAQSGFEYGNSPLVSGLVDKLMRNGWTKHDYEDRQPGDKVVRHREGSKWRNGGGRAHIGTVGADTNYAYNNDSATGRWQYEPIADVFDKQKRFVLRAPQDGVAVAKNR